MLNACVLQFRVFLESRTLLGSKIGESFWPNFLGRFDREWLNFLVDFEKSWGVAATHLILRIRFVAANYM